MQHAWRSHADLQGRFHPDDPDDLQVVIHQGGPRTSSRKAELAWVRVEALVDDVFEGVLLNAPVQLDRLIVGQRIRFVVAGGEYPVMVTEQYLAERADWQVTACDQCGLGVLFDAPSDLIAVVFP